MSGHRFSKQRPQHRQYAEGQRHGGARVAVWCGWRSVRRRKCDAVFRQRESGNQDEPPDYFSGLLAPPNDCRSGRDLLWGAKRKSFL